MRFCGTFQVIFQNNNSQNIQLRNCKVSILWHFNLKTGDTTNIKKISKGILWSGEVYESPQHKYPGLTLKNQASLVAQLVKKNLPAMQETWIQSLGWEDPLEKGKATHYSILAWRIPWTVLSIGSQRIGHDWATVTLKNRRLSTFLLCFSKILLRFTENISSMPLMNNLLKAHTTFPCRNCIFALLFYSACCPGECLPYSAVVTSVNPSQRKGRNQSEDNFRKCPELKTCPIIKVNQQSLCFQNGNIIFIFFKILHEVLLKMCFKMKVPFHFCVSYFLGVEKIRLLLSTA